MPPENTTNNSNPPSSPAQAESEPITEPAHTEQQMPETIEENSTLTSPEVKIDIEPETVQSEENQQSESPQIAEEPPKLEEIEEISEPKEQAEPPAPVRANQSEGSESIKAPVISQQDLDRLSEQIIPSAQDISITEEQKRSFWQKVMHRLAQLSRKKRQNRWQMQKQAILKLLAQKGRIKNDDVEHGLGATHRTASYYLKKMQKEKLIERHNAGKKTFYLLTPQGQAMLSSQP